LSPFNSQDVLLKTWTFYRNSGPIIKLWTFFNFLGDFGKSQTFWNTGHFLFYYLYIYCIKIIHTNYTYKLYIHYISRTILFLNLLFINPIPGRLKKVQKLAGGGKFYPPSYIWVTVAKTIYPIHMQFFLLES
jgi:hypothetical protein